MEEEPPQRLEIRRHQPNPLFEHWVKTWLLDAEQRNSKSQYKLREALEALQLYPLPLESGRECGILRGFGVKLCNLINEELRAWKSAKPAEAAANTSIILQEEVRSVVKSVKKAKRRKKLDAPSKPPPKFKLTKKQQKEKAEEEERQRQVILAAGHFRIWLLLDVQETTGRNKRQFDQTCGYLDSLDVHYEVRRLTVGDFLWIARDESGGELVLPYIVERKRMDDLAKSIRDGRFHEQKHRLRNSGIQHVIYLVEDYGNNEQLGMPIDSLKQAIVNAQVQAGLQVVHTENHWRSMMYLKNMTKTLIQTYKNKTLIGTSKEDLLPSQITDSMIGLLKFRELYEDSARNAQLTVREVFVQQLVQLHSLSLDKAAAIVELYPTPRLLLDAYEACETEQEARLLLSDIRCGALQRMIGDKISATVYDFYNLNFEN